VTEELLQPGHIVTPRDKSEKLVLWSTYMCDPDEFYEIVDLNGIMIILETKKTEKEKEVLTPEWKNGAYRVMTQDGVVGWVGSGWVISA